MKMHSGRKSIEYYPDFGNQTEFDFFYEQMLWNLKPLRNAVRVILIIDENIDISNKVIPEWVDIHSFEKARPIAISDYYFIWSKDHYWRSPSHVKMRGLVVDEFSAVNIFEVYCKFTCRLLEIEKLSSKEKLVSLLHKTAQEKTEVNIIGSGDGVSKLVDSKKFNKFKVEVNIYLGSAIIYSDLVEVVPPSYVIATDGASQFGRSKSALRFKEIILSQIRKSNITIVTLSHFQPIIFSHWPADVQDNFIYVPIEAVSEEQFSRSTSLSEIFEAYRTRNVLTCLALPFAASLTKKISFYGVTIFSKSLNEAKHWDHYKETYYRAYVADILHIHPSALPKKKNYVNNHRHILTKIMTNYSKTGCTFFSDGLEVELSQVIESPNNLSLTKYCQQHGHRFKLKIVSIVSNIIHNTYVKHIWSVVNIQLLGSLFGIFLILFCFYTDFNEFTHMQQIIMIFLISISLLVILTALKIWITRSERVLSIQSAHQFSNLEKRIADLELENTQVSEE